MNRSQNEIAEFLGKDRQTVARAIKRLGLRKEKGAGNSRMVEVNALLQFRIQSSGEDQIEMSPADRRNVEHAKKLQVEREILEHKWVPVSEAAEIVGVALDHVQRQIENSDLLPEAVTLLVEKIQDLRLSGDNSKDDGSRSDSCPPSC